jgi:hypothetical protein
MDDRQLKNLLLETCPIPPGREARAWAALRERLYATPSSRWSWLYYPSVPTRGVTIMVALVAVAVTSYFLGEIHAYRSLPMATADSQVPGVYATSFYSNSARAQVVWLNGMEPATDKPTYLDPTSVIPRSSQTPPPTGDPNSL